MDEIFVCCGSSAWQVTDAACAGLHARQHSQPGKGHGSLLLKGQASILEALLLCVQHGWMAMLVGRPGTGKRAAFLQNV